MKKLKINLKLKQYTNFKAERRVYQLIFFFFLKKIISNRMIDTLNYMILVIATAWTSLYVQIWTTKTLNEPITVTVWKMHLYIYIMRRKNLTSIILAIHEVHFSTLYFEIPLAISFNFKEYALLYDEKFMNIGSDFPSSSS